MNGMDRPCLDNSVRRSKYVNFLGYASFLGLILTSKRIVEQSVGSRNNATHTSWSSHASERFSTKLALSTSHMCKLAIFPPSPTIPNTPILGRPYTVVAGGDVATVAEPVLFHGTCKVGAVAGRATTSPCNCFGTMSGGLDQARW